MPVREGPPQPAPPPREPQRAGLRWSTVLGGLLILAAAILLLRLLA